MTYRLPEIEPCGTWVAEASCRGCETDWWFPNTKIENMRPEEEKARAICAECPVQAECLDHAYRTREQHGIYGGLRYEEREKARKKAQRDARKARNTPAPVRSRPALPYPWRDREPLSLVQEAAQAALRAVKR